MNLARTFCPLFALAFLTIEPSAFAQTLAKKIAAAEARSPKEALVLLKELDAQNPKDAAILASLSIAWSESQEDKASALVAIETAEEALRLHPESGKAHLALAIGYGKLTKHVDNETKMALSQKIRDEAIQAITFDPDSDLAHQLLGRWNYGIATLNPMLKFAARMVYGKLPPASLSEAQGFLQEATRLNPGRISNHYHLAIVYEAQKDRPKARAHWETLLKIPPKDQEDKTAQADAKKALARAAKR